MFRTPLLRLSLLLLAGVLLSHFPAARAQQMTQRLVLKDGSYQSVTKYEMQADRVHYFSAERFEWEDMPASLVDWEATKKYNDAVSSGKLRPKVSESAEEKEEREKEEANSPEIAPGLRLPGSGGVFLYNQFQGKPELAEIVQNGSDLDKPDRKKNALRAAINPFSGSKQAFEIKGEHAQIQSHVARPIIFIDIDSGPQTEAPSADRFRLLRVQPKKGNRIVGNVKVSFSGKTSQETTVIPTTLERVGTGEWLKLTPAQDLAPGEYAVIEMLAPDEMNLYVWDFGVNSSAPANPNTWQPAK